MLERSSTPLAKLVICTPNAWLSNAQASFGAKTVICTPLISLLQYKQKNVLSVCFFIGKPFHKWDTENMIGYNDYCGMLNTSTSTWVPAICNTTSNHICEFPRKFKERNMIKKTASMTYSDLHSCQEWQPFSFTFCGYKKRLIGFKYTRYM